MRFIYLFYFFTKKNYFRVLFSFFHTSVQSRPPGQPLVPEVFTFTRLGSLKFLCLSPIIRAVLWAMDAHFFKDQSFFSQVIRQIIFKIKVFSSTCFMSQNYCKTSARFIWKVFVLNSLLPGKFRTFGTLLSRYSFKLCHFYPISAGLQYYLL